MKNLASAAITTNLSLASEVGILETLDHPNRLRETFVPEQGGHGFCEIFVVSFEFILGACCE
jgi:hypothetical protein